MKGKVIFLDFGDKRDQNQSLSQITRTESRPHADPIISYLYDPDLYDRQQRGLTFFYKKIHPRVKKGIFSEGLLKELSKMKSFARENVQRYHDRLFFEQYLFFIMINGKGSAYMNRPPLAKNQRYEYPAFSQPPFFDFNPSDNNLETKGYRDIRDGEYANGALRNIEKVRNAGAYYIGNKDKMVLGNLEKNILNAKE